MFIKSLLLPASALPPPQPPIVTCQQGAHTYPTSIHPQGRSACEQPRPFLLASTSSAIGSQDKQPTTGESPESG
ncbi:hypothetical protein CFC21_052512 [Triticum aestivum]|uniref:Uncharacterized protein n=3 Tax=Triticum TaxID=4564 RepID=A0A9R0VZV4_TRITD|nr:hypothetical protein CFC21_052512 [Triticum aestivum]VAH92137.1 unnamed protein product [Triticum turgidum subsp. durum]